MSPFVLEISAHAKQRLQERSITRSQVRRCLVQGTQVRFDICGRRINALKIQGRILEVVYLRIGGGYLVITAYWKGE